MPWEKTTTIAQKIEFICEWSMGKYTIIELCDSFGISGPTTYRLIHRFEKLGYLGIKKRSRTPGESVG
jgi:DNA-binding MarR family transcriptional regulator